MSRKRFGVKGAQQKNQEPKSQTRRLRPDMMAEVQLEPRLLMAYTLVGGSANN